MTHFTAISAHAIFPLHFCQGCTGCGLDEVRSLLALDWHSTEDCAAARTTVDTHLRHVRERLQELQTLEKELVALRDCCDGHSGVCRTIEALHRRADTQDLAAAVGSAVKRHV